MELGLPEDRSCHTQVVRRAPIAVTHGFFRSDQDAVVYGGVAEACFISIVFNHFGVTNLPPPDVLARDQSFMSVTGKWFERLYLASRKDAQK